MTAAINILALDTSFGEISAAIHAGGSSFHAATHDDHGKTRSTRIVPLLDGLLQQAEISWQQLDLLALGAGPGSFTGLRIAAATLAGINSGMKLPILHLSSLAITARQADIATPLWVLEDARAGEAFVGHYHAGRALEEDRCLTWAEVSNDIAAGSYVCHATPPLALAGWQQLPLKLVRSEALLTAALAEMEKINIEQLPRYPDPVYLQRSQAEKNIHG